MSYARFGWDGSSVYVFLSSFGYLECCGCSLTPNRFGEFLSTAEMVRHLQEHQERGHTVPPETFDRLREDADWNDRWIRATQKCDSATIAALEAEYGL
jgi:hypothetical protein